METLLQTVGRLHAAFWATRTWEARVAAADAAWLELDALGELPEPDAEVSPALVRLLRDMVLNGCFGLPGVAFVRVMVRAKPHIIRVEGAARPDPWRKPGPEMPVLPGASRPARRRAQD
jgi:hypothetical protein